MLNAEIRDNSVVVELTAKGGFGSELADKIVHYLKGHKKY